MSAISALLLSTAIVVDCLGGAQAPRPAQAGHVTPLLRDYLDRSSEQLKSEDRSSSSCLVLCLTRLADLNKLHCTRAVTYADPLVNSVSLYAALSFYHSYPILHLRLTLVKRGRIPNFLVPFETTCLTRGGRPIRRNSPSRPERPFRFGICVEC